MREPYYTCCEDGLLSQVPPADRSGLCPACGPTAPTQPLLTDDDWQAIADHKLNPLAFIPGRLKELVEERIRLRLAADVKEREQPSDEQMLAVWQRHARMGPATPKELLGYGRELLATYGVEADRGGEQHGA